MKNVGIHFLLHLDRQIAGSDQFEYKLVDVYARIVDRRKETEQDVPLYKLTVCDVVVLANELFNEVLVGDWRWSHHAALKVEHARVGIIPYPFAPNKRVKLGSHLQNEWWWRSHLFCFHDTIRTNPFSGRIPNILLHNILQGYTAL